MLNETQLNLILGTDLRDITADDVHWKTQDSTATSILFYRIGDGAKALEIFSQRIKETRFRLLVVNKTHPGLPTESVVIDEAKWPVVQKAMLDVLYPLPDLKLLALTGTNGKTTTTDLVLQLGSLLGKKGLSIGTLGVRENQRTILDFGLTSPSFIDLRKFLHLYGADKDFCVLEASSHALVQSRLYGLWFDSAGWLSFSQDHLDYHLSMEAYFQAKCLIFTALKKNAKLFVPANQTELFSRLEKVSSAVSKARSVDQTLPLFFSTQFNKNNLSVAAAMITDVYQMELPRNLDQLTSPDGRFNVSAYESNLIVVDFAHTPDALENICRGIKESFPRHSLKVLFGCGGDRDRTKRPLMGAIVEKWADEIYVTSDNPRSEDPAQIIQDIMQGIKLKTAHQIIDRREAVRRAFSELTQNQVLLLAGKGHEDYILMKGIKHPYSDLKEVEAFLSRK
ncbi:MAG TPA: Mur ligase family protein [Bacteriovoracaceae bacterium]|nr:Mur ligase family protein [Bacteriovoracaceae bacterium]